MKDKLFLGPHSALDPWLDRIGTGGTGGTGPAAAVGASAAAFCQRPQLSSGKAQYAARESVIDSSDAASE